MEIRSWHPMVIGLICFASLSDTHLLCYNRVLQRDNDYPKSKGRPSSTKHRKQQRSAKRNHGHPKLTVF